MRPLVKVCGLRRSRDAELAVALGATHVGAIRAPGSPRRASLDEAKAVFDAVRGRAETVLVFKGVPCDRALREAAFVRPDTVQLYDAAEKSADRFERLGLRVLRVIPVPRDARALPPLEPPPTEARPALLDVGGGGSGTPFAWALLGAPAPYATFVAGGIRPDNVDGLVQHRPYGIDLSSGVEIAPGVKDEALLRLFFERFERSLGEVSP